MHAYIHTYIYIYTQTLYVSRYIHTHKIYRIIQCALSLVSAPRLAARGGCCLASAAEGSGVFSLQPSKDYARIAGQSVWGLVFVFFVSPGLHGCARGTAAMLKAAMQKNNRQGQS